MDKYEERPGASSAGSDSMQAQMHASEPVSRLLAYTSPYLFWVVVGGLSVGFLLLR